MRAGNCSNRIPLWSRRNPETVETGTEVKSREQHQLTPDERKLLTKLQNRRTHDPSPSEPNGRKIVNPEN